MKKFPSFIFINCINYTEYQLRAKVTQHPSTKMKFDEPAGLVDQGYHFVQHRLLHPEKKR